MKVYRTEEEQIGEIRQFFQKYGKIVIISLVVSMSVLWGWRYWKGHQKTTLEAASTTYERLISQLGSATNDMPIIQEAAEYAKNTDNVYGVLTGMKLAQFYAGEENYTQAQQTLESIVKNTQDPELLATINLRIARLQFQQGQTEQALANLDKVTIKSWAAQANDLRGDILVAKEQYLDAYNAYTLALTFNSDERFKQDLQVKLNHTEYLKNKQLADEAKQ